MPRATSAVPVLVLVLVAALAGGQLLVPPVVGVADNGDYIRVMAPLGLAHVGTTYEDTVFLWVQLKYKMVPADASQLLPSSEHLLAGTARGLHALLLPDRPFDLRILGSVHLAFYLFGVWLVIAAARTLGPAARVTVWIGALLVTADVAYVAYLNSFYSEPAAVIFLLIWLGVTLRWVRADRPRPGITLAYFVCAGLFAITKVQNYGLVLPLIGLPIALLASRPWRSTWTAVVPLAAVLLAFTLVLFVRLPDALRHPARWNALFYGLLVGSPSPADDLAEFGLEPELARWTGVPAIEVDGRWVSAPVMEVGGRYGFREIAQFYLRHPERLVKVTAMCAQRTFVWRMRGWPTLGNYTRDSGRPPGSHAPSYTGWSDLQERVLPRRLWFLVAFFGLYLGVAVWNLRSGLDTPDARTALVCLTVAGMAVMAFAILVMAGGIEDPVTDLFMFRVLFDVCLVTALAWVATRFARLLPTRQAEAGPRA